MTELTARKFRYTVEIVPLPHNVPVNFRPVSLERLERTVDRDESRN
jgi:hypothetical protein